MIIVFFVFGLIVGSFLNAVIYRLHSGDSIALGRSVCPHCRHVLAAKDLVPLFSFIERKGRCRYCDKPISWQYPMVEAITGIAFVLFAWQFNFHISEMLVFELVVACTLIVIAVFDFKHYLILDKVIAFGSGIVALQIIYAISILKQPLFDMASPLIQALLGIAVISGFFGLQYLISHGRWIGLGDVKLGLFLGALFGLSRSLVLLLIAYIAGAVVGVALIVWDKKKLSSRLPFGIFLGFAGIVVMLYGQQILDWYLALIGF